MVAPVRVLVADDQELIRDGLIAILDGQPELEVVGAAAGGTEAVEQALRLRPDVTLMDVRMPDLDGVEATRRILAVDPPPTRVLVLTTFDDDDLVLAALAAGASGFLLKDLPRRRLVDAVVAAAAGEMQFSPRITARLVELHVRRRHDPERAATLERLTARELEILRLVAAGASNAEIGAQLFLSLSTVKTHVGQLLAKTGLRDRVQLVIFAYDAGLAR